jgi:hypothetical protein
MHATVEEKYGIIRERDERFAFELAKLIMEKPKVPIWIIFLPFLFVFYAHWLQRYKKGLRQFVNHYLKNKVLALEAALEESRGGKILKEGWVSHLGGQAGHGVGEVVDLENRELSILKKHYRLLLRSSGRSYPELLRNGYGKAGEYRFFLNRLVGIEEEINKAVLKLHHPTPEAREVVECMEKHSEKLREMELDLIFG